MPSRVIEITRHVGLSDVRPDATMRLDAVARVVQDVADYDAATSEIDEMGVWILRRLAFDLAHTPRFRADLRAHTWCSGVGARWAERRTDVFVGERPCVHATAVWVHVDPERGTPVPLPRAFSEVWGSPPRVSAKLVHDGPPAGLSGSRWPLRATDIDVIGHVNNAAYWAPVEEELVRRGRPRVRAAEIEFRAGLDPDDDVHVIIAERGDGFACWLLVGADVRASMLVGCGP